PSPSCVVKGSRRASVGRRGLDDLSAQGTGAGSEQGGRIVGADRPDGRPTGTPQLPGQPRSVQSKNSSAVSTGFPQRAALFALADCEPASATTSTSVLDLVRFAAGTRPRASARSCSCSLSTTPRTGCCTVPEKQIRAPGTSTWSGRGGPVTSRSAGRIVMFNRASTARRPLHV